MAIYEWSGSGGTYTLKEQGKDEALATITGLRDGLTLPTDSTTISLTDDMLPESPGEGAEVTISGEGYSLAIGTATAFTETIALGEIASGTATITKTQTAGWEASGSGFIYRTADPAENLATITLSDSTKIGGLSFNSAGNNTVVTVSTDAFDTDNGSTVSITNHTSTAYTLSASLGALQQTPTVSEPALNADKTAIVQNSTAYYQTTSTAIQYFKAETETLATISGLVSDANPTLDKEAGTLTIAKTDVGTTDGDTVTLTNVGSNNFTLDLTGKNGEGVVEGTNDAATWKLEGSEAKYYAEGTKDTWTLDGNTVTYTAKTQDDVVATVSGSGLIALTDDNVKTLGITDEDTESPTVTVPNDLLQSSPTKDMTVSVTGATLTLNDATMFDANASSQTLSVAASGTDATITRPRAEGWKADNATAATSYTYTAADTLTLATVSGLKTGVTSAAVSVDKSTKVVTLGSDALVDADTCNITIADAATPDTTFNGFTLALGTVQKTVEDDTTATVTGIENGVATVKSDVKAYWTLGGDNKSVSYVPKSLGTGTEEATVSGLADTATITNVTVDKSTTTITLSEGALKTNQNATYDVEVTGTGNYTLTLNGFNDAANVEAGTVTSAFTEETDGSGNTTKTLKVTKDYKEYWTGSGTKSITYKPKDTTHADDSDADKAVALLATVSKLAVTASDANVKLGDTEETKTTIYLQSGALKTNQDTTYDVEVTGTGNYTLALNGFNTSATEDAGTVTLDVDGSAGTAKVTTDYKEYWTLATEGGDANKKITYTPKNTTHTTDATPNDAVVASVSGLGSGASNSTVSLDGTTIKLKSGALKSKDVLADALAAGAEVQLTSSTYSLAFDGEVQAYGENSGDPYLALTESAGSKGAVVKQNLTKGWKFKDDDPNTIEYKEPAALELATISGLGDGVSISENISLGTEEDTKTTITLKTGALKKADVTLTDTKGKGYKLALGNVAEPAADPGTPVLTVTDGTATYKRTPSEGWTLATGDNPTAITYSQPDDVTLLEITGLKTSAVKRHITINDVTGKITIQSAALDTTDGTAVKITTNHGDNNVSYKLVRGDLIENATSVSNAALTVTNGTAKIKGTLSAGWELASDGQKLTYRTAKTDQTVATIEGLASTATASNVEFNANLGTITLKDGSLKAGNVELTTKYNYQLVLDGADGSGKLGGDAVGYWTKKGTTAKYYAADAEKWTLAADKKSIAYYGIGDGALKATITNLSRDFVCGDETDPDSDGQTRYGSIGTNIDGTYVAGVSVAGNTITLSKNILGTTEVMEFTSEDGNDAYTVALNTTDNTAPGWVRDTPALGQKFWEYGTTTTYKQADLEYWDKDGNTITYHPQENEETLATITGLNGAITENDISTVDTNDIDKDSDGKFKITLNANALNARDVNITSEDYKLALNSDSTDTGKYVAPPVLSNKAWSLNDANTIAYYKADVTAGYEAASDGSSITYTATATDKEIAKVTGLNGGNLVVTADSNDVANQAIGVKDPTTGDVTIALSFDATETKQINLTSGVLGTSNLAVTGTNYTLNVAVDHDNGIYLSTADHEATTGVDVWRVDGTTATYKTVKYANYGIAADGKSITYTPETDVADGLKATVTGLKSGLTVADDGQSLTGTDTEGNPVTEVVALDTTTVRLKPEALGTMHVEVSTGYTLDFDDPDDAEKLKPQMAADPNLTWAIDDTTATTVHLRGIKAAGYEIDNVSSSDTYNRKIIYTPADTNHTFATITGLKSGLTDADLAGITGITNATTKDIELDSRVLGTTEVKLDTAGIKAGYTLGVVAKSDPTDPEDYGVYNDNTTTVNVWEVSGTTATYKEMTEAFYTVGTQDNTTGDNKITYTGRAAGTTLATLTGLKSGLTVVNDAIAGIDTEDGGTTFTISRDVLGTTDVTITPRTGTTLTFTLAEDAAPEQTSEYYWTVSGTTAKYQFNSAAGYTQAGANADIEYQQARSGNSANTVVTIDGLKRGITKAIVEAGISVVDNKEFTPDDTVLGTGSSTITLETGNGADATDLDGYKFGTLNSDLAPESGKTGWHYVEGVLTLSNYTTSGYELDSDDATDRTINYTGGTFGTDILTVTGLKANLSIPDPETADKDKGAQIDGIAVDTSGHTVTLSKNVLTTDANTNVKLSDGSGYSLALNDTADDPGKVAVPEYKKAWAFKNGTATLTEEMSAGYTIGASGADDEGQVIYNPKETVTTTISGLKNTVTVSTDKQSIGIYDSTAETYSGIDAPNKNIASTTAATPVTTPIPKTGTFALDSTVLDNKTVTLTQTSTKKDSGYTLGLSGVTTATVEAAAWFKEANSTKATYQTMTSQGYLANADSTKFTYYNNTSGTPTVLATINGLGKTVTQDEVRAAIPVADITAPVAEVTDPITGDITTPAAKGTITINNSSIFGKNNVTLTATDYIMKFNSGDDAFKVGYIANADATWTYDGKKGTANLVAGKTEGWAFKTTTKNGTTTTDYKTIVYTKAAPVTIATVTGLAKSTTYKPIAVSSDNDGKSVLRYGNGAEQYSLIATFSSNGDKNAENTNTTNTAAATILVDKGVLTTETKNSNNAIVSSNATVSVSSRSGYTFTLKADSDVYTPQDGDKYWTVDDKGNAYYKYDTTEGYTPNTTKTTLTYSAEKSGNTATVIATISGLVTETMAAKDTTNTKKAVQQTAAGVKLTEIDGIRVTAPVAEDDATTTDIDERIGLFTLWDSSILGNKVTLKIGKNQLDYDLDVAPEIAVVKGTVADNAAKWYLSGTKATYRLYDTEGYINTDTKNQKVVEFKRETPSTTLVTLQGISKKDENGDAITADRINDENLIKVNPDNTITLTADVRANAHITLSNGIETPKTKTSAAIYYPYKFANDSYNAREALDPVWSYSKGTATLKQTTSDGFTLGDYDESKGQQKLTYSKASTATLATVKGLATNLAILTDAQAAAYNTANNLTGADVIEAGELYVATTTRSGKSKVTTYSNTPLLSLDANKVITLSKDALATSKVTLSGTGYKLALNSGVATSPVSVSEWVVSGTTANYKKYNQAYHTLNAAGTAITYVKPTAGVVYATVSGLNKSTTTSADLNNNWTAADGKDKFTTDPTLGGTLKLDSRQLTTATAKVVTKLANTGNYDGFALTLDTATGSDYKVTASTLSTGSVWTNNGKGTVTLKGTLSQGYTPEFGGKMITYNKAEKSVTVATITGLADNARIESADVSGGVITLQKADLTNKNVAVTTSAGNINYTLNIDSDLAPTFVTDSAYAGEGATAADAKNPSKKTPGWAVSGAKGTLKGYVSEAGYTLSASGTAITYTGATTVNKKTVSGEDVYTYKDTATLTTLNGVKSGVGAPDELTGTISLDKSNTNGNVTLGNSLFAVEIGGDYAGKSITGSAGADNLTVQATGKTITGGKGDDNITLGSNTFVYNNGDGHDVIADFTGTNQKLQVNSGTVSVGKVDGDLVVKVGAGSINLGSNYSGNTIDIYAKDGKTKTTYAIAGAGGGSPNPLLVDDNYNMDAASLSDIVQPDSASFTPYDFDGGFSLTKEDKLTPQISYNNSDKK